MTPQAKQPTRQEPETYEIRRPSEEEIDRNLTRRAKQWVRRIDVDKR